MNKLRILFVVDDFGGGAGNVVQILANEFLYKGNEVAVLLLHCHTQNNRLDKEVKIIKKSITSQNASNKITWLIYTLKELEELIVGVNPDVVISFLDNNNTLVGLSLMFKDIPLIVSERSNPIIIKPKLLWRLLRIPAYLRANSIIVQCSNFINFNRLFYRKISVIPNPVIKPNVSKEQNYKKSSIKLVSVGRLAIVKQFSLMIEVFDRINKQFPNTELYIYGEGTERNNLEKLIKRLSLQNKVFLPGRTNEVYNVLIDSDIFLMTSKQEGFPNALSEAMAIGLPIVAFECHEGLRDIVDNGENGFLVPPGDINDMVKHIGLLIKDADLRYTLSKRARGILEKFGIESVLNMWEEVIKRIGGYK
jgi:GalNAc-alpha-(1->4)-GalNAc-alpha-(1->3)-diNAcBac-PP-undecaprenol alpha-1,4-N-acetyl-D-galactosaminyltransferase